MHLATSLLEIAPRVVFLLVALIASPTEPLSGTIAMHLAPPGLLETPWIVILLLALIVSPTSYDTSLTVSRRGWTPRRPIKTPPTPGTGCQGDTNSGVRR